MLILTTVWSASKPWYTVITTVIVPALRGVPRITPALGTTVSPAGIVDGVNVVVCTIPATWGNTSPIAGPRGRG